MKKLLFLLTFLFIAPLYTQDEAPKAITTPSEVNSTLGKDSRISDEENKENANTAQTNGTEQARKEKENTIEIDTRITDDTEELILPPPPAMEEPKVIEEQKEVIREAATETSSQTQNGKKEDKEISLASSAEISIGLDAEVRQKIVTILNILLADEFVLYTKTLKFYWNVQGKEFANVRSLLKKQYKKLFKTIDQLAERARVLGAPALGSMQEFTTYARLKEISADKVAANDMIKQLLADQETIIRMIREAITSIASLNDHGSIDLLQNILIKQEKLAWKLRASSN